MTEIRMAPWCASANPNPPEMRTLLSRRGFLRAGLAVTGAGIVTSLTPWPAWAEECVDGAGTIPVEQRNIQLFTLLAAHLASPHATLLALSQIGYQNVEHIGTYLPDAATFRQAMDAAGISAPTGHTGITHPFDEAQVMGLIEDAHVIGHQWLIDPGTNAGSTVEGWAAFADTMNKAGELAVANDLAGVAHHNHSHEYVPLDDGDGKFAIDVLMERCDPTVTSQEMDLCWVWSAGVDPVEILERYPHRFRWFHVKDMNEAGQPTFPGQGLIDFNRIFEAGARTQVIEQYIIEQDAAPTGFESAQLGWDLLAAASFACPSQEEEGEPAPEATDPAPTPEPAPTSPASPAPAASGAAPIAAPLPDTGGGLAALGLAGLGAVMALRNRGRQ